MSYIEESLSKGEEIYRVFPHHYMVKVSIAIHFILGACTAGFYLPIAILIWLGWRNTEQGVTNKRVIHKHGVISRKTDEMRLSAIESIIIKQGIFGRIFGYGTIIVAGRGTGDLSVKWMKDPMRVKIDIESADHVD